MTARNVWWFRGCILSLLLVTSFFVSENTQAAFLYFDPLSADIYRGDIISLDVRIDTDEGECINTVDAVIQYEAPIRAVDVSRGDSILNVWVEEPTINEENRTITFAGGIPGGYCGRIPGDPELTNVIATLVFRSPGFSVGGAKSPTARISIADESQVLLHDGFGTPAGLRVQDATITLLDTPGSTQTDEWRQAIQSDTELPSDFSITLTKDASAFSGRYFIVFNAVDKQSGIDHYEILEEPFSEFWSFGWGRADAPWKPATSPYVLEDQSLQSTIWVKAVDKAGNERVTKIVPDSALQTLTRNQVLVMLFVSITLFIVVGLAGYALWRRKRDKVTLEEHENEDT